jgi:hypothetical protein
MSGKELTPANRLKFLVAEYFDKQKDFADKVEINVNLSN